jgi:hypothetical protein
MSLQGTGVRIIIHEPSGWSKGNLFGTILSSRGKKILIVKLSEKISSNNLISDLIELSPRNQSESFKSLAQQYSVMVNGNLVSENYDRKEYLLYGSVTFD